MSNTKASLIQQNTQTYPSNTSGSITALNVKSFNNNFINAVATLGDTNVFTEPQTFGNTVQVNSNVIANNFVGPLIGTASWANNAVNSISASYFSGSITNAISASYASVASAVAVTSDNGNQNHKVLFANSTSSNETLLYDPNDFEYNPNQNLLTVTASYANFAISASYAANAPIINTGSFATTGSNTFNGTNTFTGSLNAQSASIKFLTVDTIVSSSTIFSSGSNTLGDAPGDTQTLWGTVNLPSGPLNVQGTITGSGALLGDKNSNTYVDFIAGGGAVLVEGTNVHITSSTLYLDQNSNITVKSGSNVVIESTGNLTLNNGAKLYTGASTGSIGEVLKRTANGVEWQSDNSGSTIDTGSLATTGSNTFRGTETISGSIYLNTITGSGTAAGPLFSNFTQSGVVSGYRDGGNLFMFRNSSQSGSVIITGSSNVGLVAEPTNTEALTRIGGGNINQSMGTFDVQYTSGSLPPLLFNVNQQAPIRITLPTSSVHSASFTNTYIGGPVTISGSNNAPITIQNSSLNNLIIKADSSGSNNGLNIGALLQIGGNNASAIFVSQSTAGASRFVQGTMMVGSFHTASLDATTGSNSGMVNVGMIGCGLFVSGTATSTVSTNTAGVFVGSFNETSSFLVGANTRSLADPTFVKFAVGAGTAAGSRLTALWVSSSGQTFSRRGIFTSGSGTNPAFVYTGSVQGTGSIDILNGSLTLQTGSLSIITGSLNIGNSAVNTNRIFQRGGNAQIASEGGGGSTYEVLASQSVVMASSQSQALAGGFNGSIISSRNSSLREAVSRVAIIAGDNIETSNVSASVNSAVIGGNNNTLNQATGSLILAGNNTQINQGSYVVALGRDTAYNISGSYTLYTQNIDASGSVNINGALLINGAPFAGINTGSFMVNATALNNNITFTKGDASTFSVTVATGSAFPFTGSAQVSGTLAFTGSLLGHINTGVPMVVNFGDNTVTTPGNNGRNFTFGASITNASENNGAAFGESHNLQNPSYNSFIGGGNGNTINANKAFAGGGTSNSVTAVEGAVIGGSSNSVSHQASVVLGGSGISSTQTNEVSVPHLRVTGSATINDVLVLPFQSPLPSGKPTGSLALSGSGATYVGMFVYDGTNWVSA